MSTTYLTVRQVAERLSVTPDKIIDLIHSGQLVAINMALHAGGRARWRIAPEDLERFLAARQSRPAPAPPPRRRRQQDVTTYY